MQLRLGVSGAGHLQRPLYATHDAVARLLGIDFHDGGSFGVVHGMDLRMDREKSSSGPEHKTHGFLEYEDSDSSFKMLI